MFVGTVKSQTQKSEKRLLTSTYGKGVRKPFVLNVLSFVLALLAQVRQHGLIWGESCHI
jgi:hypothetical protein